MKTNKLSLVSMCAAILLTGQLNATNNGIKKLIPKQWQQKRNLGKAKTLLKELKKRHEKIENVTKEENKTLTKRLNEIMRKLKTYDGDKPKKLYDQLRKAARDLLVERYDRVKYLKNGILSLLEAPVTKEGLWVFKDMKKKAKEIKIDEKQKKFWQLIYGDIADTIREIRIIEESIKTFPDVKRKPYTSATSDEEAQAQFLVTELKKLLKPIKTFGDINLSSYRKKIGGLSRKDASETIEAIYTIYEMKVDKILKNITAYIYKQTKTLKSEAEKNQNPSMTNLDIARQLTPLIAPLETLEKGEKDSELRRRYALTAKMTRRSIEKIRASFS